MKTFGKVVGTIVLLLMAVVGLLMSLCGGAFTVSNLGGAMSALLVISIPSLVSGIALVWIACRKLGRRFGKPPGS